MKIGGNFAAPGSRFECSPSDTFAELLEKVKARDMRTTEDLTHYDMVCSQDGSEFPPKDRVTAWVKDNDVVLIYKSGLVEMERFADLRPFQIELVDKAVHRNSIVVCPTGAGKTFISIAVYNRLKQLSGKQLFTGLLCACVHVCVCGV